MPDSPAVQIAAFLAKFEPAMARRIKANRAALRKRFPTAYELVYDNYNFLVFGFGFGAAPRVSDCFVSLAANSSGMILSFLKGATIPDPAGLLQGSGTQNRFLRLASPDQLDQPEIAALLAAAVAQCRTPLPETCRGETIIKSISGKQRPRR